MKESLFHGTCEIKVSLSYFAQKVVTPALGISTLCGDPACAPREIQKERPVRCESHRKVRLILLSLLFHALCNAHYCITLCIPINLRQSYKQSKLRDRHESSGQSCATLVRSACFQRTLLHLLIDPLRPLFTSTRTRTRTHTRPPCLP